ncbi:MAG: N-acetylmuramoyl-L-alanine amidase [Bacteroidales bacterium]|jgi:N-acetylmuramoyl-L-alanine amidase|nr:N-acetylmuramoyl-L-alanine amidase [Bacteroidales bacterium]
MKKNLLIFLVFYLNYWGLPNLFAQSQDSLKTIVAEKGDGIYKILRENGYIAKDYYHAFKELNIDKIKDEDQLILGETYYLPAIFSEILEENIEDDTTSIKPSGFTYADTIISNKLDGAIIYLISGHGGPDPGAVANVNGIMISEDEYAYDICLRMAKAIEENGGKAYMIIEDPDDGIRDEEYLQIDYDEYCYPDLEIPREQNARLKQRADAVNDLYKTHKSTDYQRVIEIHLDSRSNSATVDVFFYHYPGSTKGKKTAEVFQNIFSEKYAKHQPNRGYKGSVTNRNLLVMRKVLPPLVFIELGNIQNEKDRKRFLKWSNRQAIANWLVEGLIRDFSE